MSSWIEGIPERPVLKELVGEWLTKRVSSTSTGGGIVSSYDVLQKFSNYPNMLWAIYPEQTETLIATDIAEPLANTFRIGVLDEFGFPAWDEARAKFPNRDELRASYNFPYLIVWDKVNIRLLGPNGIEQEAELPAHKEYELTDALYSDGQILLILKKQWTEYAQWLGTEKIFQTEDNLSYRNNCVLLPMGERYLTAAASSQRATTSFLTTMKSRPVWCPMGSGSGKLQITTRRIESGFSTIR